MHILGELLLSTWEVYQTCQLTKKSCSRLCVALCLGEFRLQEESTVQWFLTSYIFFTFSITN